MWVVGSGQCSRGSNGHLALEMPLAGRHSIPCIAIASAVSCEWHKPCYLSADKAAPEDRPSSRRLRATHGGGVSTW
jgi:hypothetical protein